MNMMMQQYQQPTMSSLEVATLVEARHDSVRRTIERLADRGVIQLPPLVEVKNHLRQRVGVYSFEGEKGKRDSYVVVAQLCPEFTARLVDRWQELERQPARPVLPDFTDPAAAARAWADEVELKRQAAAQLAEATPKLEALDRIATSSGTMCITDAAKVLQVPPRQLFRWMQDNRWIYRRTDNGDWVAFQKRLTQGCLSHKVTTISQGDAPDKVREQVLVTRKGLARIAELISKVGGIGNVVRGDFGVDAAQGDLL